MLCVGFSGGLDSTVLLHAAQRLYHGRVIALHVNHGLHADAVAWNEHCAEMCRDWQIEFRSRAVTVHGGNVEAAARAARYTYFAEQLRAADLLLLAHHQDDQAETVLLRLAQGRGLIGMPQMRPVGRGRLLRPLLELPRSELEKYAEAWDLRSVEDPSNADPRFDRNYLRTRVMPVLRSRWPRIGETLQELLAQRRCVDEILLAELEPLSSALAISDLRRPSEVATLELLRVWLLARGAAAPSGRALRSFVAQLDSPADRQPELVLSSGSLRRYRQSIFHVPDCPPLEASYALKLPGGVSLPHGELEVSSAAAKGFTPVGEVHVVFRRDRPECGELLLLRGHRRSVNKLLQAADVPPWDRPNYPLLEDASGLVAIPGIGYRDSDPNLAAGHDRQFQAKWRPDVR